MLAAPWRYWPKAGWPFATVGTIRAPRRASPAFISRPMASRPCSHHGTGGMDVVASSARSVTRRSMSWLSNAST